MTTDSPPDPPAEPPIVDALAAQVGDLAAQVAVLARRVARLEQISGWVPDDIEQVDAQDVAAEQAEARADG